MYLFVCIYICVYHLCTTVHHLCATVLLAEVFTDGEIKLRSSANAEDIPGFDGAGLYDSFKAKLKKKDNPDGSCAVAEKGGSKLKMTPQTLQCSIKGVFASLWNLRAVAERTRARLDHATAVMGVAA